jgi:ferredoxin, 2Fe-2S
MANVKFIYPNGREQHVQIDPGDSLMEGARRVGVSGIEGECGGNMSCATCHVYVDDEWLDKLDSIDTMEDEILEGAASPRRSTSRLSCQLTMSEALDGIRIYIPETQY